MNYLARSQKILDIELAELKQVRAPQQLDGSFDRAVEKPIVDTLRPTWGMEQSWSWAWKIRQYRVKKSTPHSPAPGPRASCSTCGKPLTADWASLTDGAIAILALGYSGESEELLNLVSLLNEGSVFCFKIISITGMGHLAGFASDLWF